MKSDGDGRGTRPAQSVVGERRKLESRGELGRVIVVLAFCRYSME